MKRLPLQSLSEEVKEFFSSLRSEDTPVIVEDGGRAVAAVVPPWQLDSREESRRKLLQLMNQLHEANKDTSLEQIEADIEAALQDVRQQRP